MMTVDKRKRPAKPVRETLSFGYSTLRSRLLDGDFVREELLDSCVMLIVMFFVCIQG